MMKEWRRSREGAEKEEGREGERVCPQEREREERERDEREKRERKERDKAENKKRIDKKNSLRHLDHPCCALEAS